MGEAEPGSIAEELGSMSQKRTAKKNSRPAVSREPDEVVRVETRPGFVLWVEFADGTNGIVELENFLFQPSAGVFRPLQDPAKFAEAYVHSDGFVAWPGGQDLAPDAMYEDIKKTGRRVAGSYDED